MPWELLGMSLLCWLGTDLPGCRVQSSASWFSFLGTYHDWLSAKDVGEQCSKPCFFIFTAISLRLPGKLNSYRAQHAGVAPQPHPFL